MSEDFAMQSNDFFSVELDENGVAVLTWDAKDGAVNVFSESAIEAFRQAVQQLVGDDEVKGVVIASAKSVFHVGADLAMAQALGTQSVEVLFSTISGINAVFRAMETGGKPFVAAINGHSLGGGFEMAMACHARFLSDNAKIEMGLPESKLGLMPGFGGTQRLPRLIALDKALPMMLTGHSLRPKQALELGLVTAIVADAELVSKAKAWALANAGAQQPWDRKGFTLPSGSVQSPQNFQFFIGASAQARKTTGGHYPAIPAILEAVYHGLQIPIDPAIRIETRRFIRIAHSPVSRAMIRTLFFGLNDSNRLARKPAGFESRVISKVGIVGTGLMGAGIAYQAARNGLEVVTLDINPDAASKGVAYSARLLEKQLSRGRTSQSKIDAHLALIKPTVDYADLAECDFVIEAVFESKEIKEKVLRAVCNTIRPDAIIASNTSTIPISELAHYVDNPTRLIGLHFFSPVEKMPLVEIISGNKTATATLAAAFDLCKLLGKTPIDVNDGRAFFTTRVVSSYIMEGMALVAEGVAPVLIENAGLQLGMPMGPLRLADMVNLDLAVKIDDQSRDDLGEDYVDHPGILVARRLAELGRLGKKVQAGFYDHADGQSRLWHGLVFEFPVSEIQPNVVQVKDRLMIIQMIETLRCFDSKVLKSPEDADIGSIFGWGFPPFTGGIASHIDEIGPAHLLQQSQRFAVTNGSRFAPPDTLRKMAADHTLFYAR